VGCTRGCGSSRRRHGFIALAEDESDDVAQLLARQFQIRHLPILRDIGQRLQVTPQRVRCDAGLLGNILEIARTRRSDVIGFERLIRGHYVTTGASKQCEGASSCCVTFGSLALCCRRWFSGPRGQHNCGQSNERSDFQASAPKLRNHPYPKTTAVKFRSCFSGSWLARCQILSSRSDKITIMRQDGDAAAMPRSFNNAPIEASGRAVGLGSVRRREPA
jgi:hypothetical protein